MKAPVLAALGVLGCGALPKDIDETTERVRGGVLRVAVVEDPPWVVSTAEPSGVEIALVRDFAATLDATVSFVTLGRSEAFEALEHGTVDLVVGGIDKKDPWSRRVGLTRPWFTERVCLGEVADAAPTDPVYTREGEPAAKKIARRHEVRFAPEIPADARRALGPDWDLEARGFTVTDRCPGTSRRVWAVIPGENRFLLEADRFLADREAEVRAALIRGARGGES